MFIGIFVMLAGALGLAEATGLINTDVKWGIPLAVTCFGASLLWEAIQTKKSSQ
ncbi:hypothetical protein SBP02_06945 [Pseudomonas benzenivorans]|uniref:Uncharacterized protein n=1 Tax=Pseudomonas benzenivorans TaxID=556533 RepID=A0ABZ0Q152_9PSED|nr:hypothetical protein [Pseudomonas benzenivorans]WPC06487.1 hypothetical protein SBP02_06945 [Pseudomonas benzenivorans]